METCQRAGELDVRRFHALPKWVQAMQLGHTVNLLTDAYRSGRDQPRRPQSPEHVRAVLEEDRRRREARAAEAQRAQQGGR